MKGGDDRRGMIKEKRRRPRTSREDRVTPCLCLMQQPRHSDECAAAANLPTLSFNIQGSRKSRHSTTQQQKTKYMSQLVYLIQIPPLRTSLCLTLNKLRDSCHVFMFIKALKVIFPLNIDGKFRPE